MKSICLISPSSPFLIDDKVFPPLGLLYIGGELKRRGYDVKVYDGETKDIPSGYDIYGVSLTTPQYPQAAEIVKHLRSMSGDVKIVAGGPHATVDPESCLKIGFDSVVMQSGEASLPLVAEHGCRQIETPWSGENHPDRSLIDLNNYKYEIDGRRATSVMTTRGCPYQCGFCCKVNKRVKVFSADFVLDELRELKNVYGYRAFMFYDDIFILNVNRLFTILDEIKKWDIIWRGFVRADIVAKNGIEVAKRMYESGCREVGMGIESGSETILRNINKGETTDTMKKGIAILKEAGIRVKGFLIVGLPGESLDTIGETQRFLRTSGLDDMDFSLFTPYKKTTIYENKDKFDIHWDALDLNHLWYKGTPGEYESQVWTSALSRQDLVAARDILEKEFKHWTRGKHESAAGISEAVCQR
ncbi:MAG TPA: radical SAM protein [Candidatus Paceibacterota bacterium]